MNNDITKLIRESANTALDIVQMTQYRIQYVQERDQEAKRKMYKYALLSCLGIASLFAIGLSGYHNS